MAVYLFVALCLTPVVICQGLLVGGYTNVDPKRQDVQDAVNFALLKYNEKSNDAQLYKALDTVSAQTQVVAGTNYKLVVIIGRTSCQKNHVGDSGLGACDMANSEVSETLQCTFKVFQGLETPERKFRFESDDCNPQNK